MNATVKKIGLVGSAKDAITRSLFRVLASPFRVTFENVTDPDVGSCDGLIVLDGSLPKAEPKVPTLFVLPAARLVENARIQFGQSQSVPKVFRNREVKQTRAAIFDKSKLDERDEIIASAEGQPVWTARKEGACFRQICAVSFEQLEKAQPLFRHLSADNFAHLLPILNFLRHVTEEDAWSSPPLRANLMIDDPNLHAANYGWINFRELAQSAKRHNYHASVATIPLDAWFGSKSAVNLFAENHARLSLLIHGNDHLRTELASFPSEEQRMASMAQALRRISKLEAKTALTVSRVMAAPHDACSQETFSAMARLGFEAACISHGTFYRFNSDQAWADSFGLGMSEMVAGLPVIPRFALTNDCQNATLLAAYLDQPIIPVGHHQEMADGLEMLENFAAVANSLGEIRWLDMKEISRSDFKSRREGDHLKVRTYSRIFNLIVPANVTQLSVREPHPASALTEGINIRTAGKADQFFPSYAGEAIPVSPGAALEITLVPPHQIDPNSVRAPKLTIWPMARRIMTEGRDRLAPFAGEIKKKMRGQRAVKA